MRASATKTVIMGVLALVAMAGMMSESQANPSPMPQDDIPTSGQAQQAGYGGYVYDPTPAYTVSSAPAPAPTPAAEIKKSPEVIAAENKKALEKTTVIFVLGKYFSSI